MIVLPLIAFGFISSPCLKPLKFYCVMGSPLQKPLFQVFSRRAFICLASAIARLSLACTSC